MIEAIHFPFVPRNAIGRALWPGLFLLWVLFVGAGMTWYFTKQIQPGRRGTTPEHWPADSRLPRDPHGSTLLVFLHPNCPCSRATVHSLQRVIGALPEAARPRTVFVLRDPAAADWRVSDLLKDAAMTPGASQFRDENEREMRRFGAEVSGHTLLYDRNGLLTLDGGITAERGQEGPSTAADRLHDHLIGMRQTPEKTAVFGCALHTPRPTSPKGAPSCPAP